MLLRGGNAVDAITERGEGSREFPVVGVFPGKVSTDGERKGKRWARWAYEETRVQESVHEMAILLAKFSPSVLVKHAKVH